MLFFNKKNKQPDIFQKWLSFSKELRELENKQDPWQNFLNLTLHFFGAPSGSLLTLRDSASKFQLKEWLVRKPLHYCVEADYEFISYLKEKGSIQFKEKIIKECTRTDVKNAAIQYFVEFNCNAVMPLLIGSKWVGLLNLNRDPKSSDCTDYILAAKASELILSYFVCQFAQEKQINASQIANFSKVGLAESKVFNLAQHSAKKTGKEKPEKTNIARLELLPVLEKALLLTEAKLSQNKNRVTHHLDTGDVVYAHPAKLKFLFVNILCMISDCLNSGLIEIYKHTKGERLQIDFQFSKPTNSNQALVFDPVALKACQRVLEQHFGRLQIKSDNPKIVEMSFSLPLKPANFSLGSAVHQGLAADGNLAVDGFDYDS